MGQTFNNSGDFRGANVVQGSKIKELHQSAQTIATGGSGQHKELAELGKKLAALLEGVPESAKADADTAGLSAQQILTEIQKPTADPSLLQLYATALRATAEKLLPHVPTIVDVADKLVSIAMKISGSGA